jgi:peptidoglycan/LPS O-acetylase OafA/YrhL
MDFYSVWPFFGSLAVLLALAATPLFAAADVPPNPRPNRVKTVDGLRGFLALAVVFHHVAAYHAFIVDGRWVEPPSRFYALLGPIGVSMFFMVTGFLFWSRLIRARKPISWSQLYIGRLFRIGPLYLAATVAMLMVVLVLTGFRLRISVLHLCLELGRWFMLGAIPGTGVNGYTDAALLLAGVTWTIHWEWVFYLSLPILGLAARKRHLHLPLVSGALIGCLIYAALHPPSKEMLGLMMSRGRPNAVVIALFLVGMLCASLDEKGLRLRLSDRTASVMALVLLASVFLFRNGYAAGPVILLGATFFLIISGCTIFGLLVSRPAIRLGDVSYGIYLLQGLALAAFFRPPTLRALAIASPVYHWCLGLLSACVLIAVAVVAHVAIERPGIVLGKRMANAFKRKTQSWRATHAPQQSDLESAK